MKRPWPPSGLTALLLVPGVAFSVAAPIVEDPPESGGATVPRHACPADLHGAWTADLDAGRLFGVGVTITALPDGEYEATVRFPARDERVPVWRQGDRLRFQPVSHPIAFDGRVEDDGSLSLFVFHASHIAHTRLPPATDGSWSAEWNALGIPVGRVRLDLYIERQEDGTSAGFFFFRDPRFPALFGEGLTCSGNSVSLRERNLALRFQGFFEGETDEVRLEAVSPTASHPVVFRRMPEGQVPALPDASLAPARAAAAAAYRDEAPEEIGDGWETARPSDAGLDPEFIGALVRAVAEEAMVGTHSVLVARHGKLVVEEYFYGFDRATWHDMRSASKTVASTLVGLAARDGHVEGAAAPALRYLPYRRYDHWDPRKARITLQDLMTMSSGLDANDYDPRSAASESAYQSQRARPDWVKLALDASMIGDPGAQPLYGGANPLILGGVLDAALPEPLEWFADRTLFAPLAISEYQWFTSPTGVPYLGGGLHLRPRDMLKYGQLYLDGGVWQGTRILPEAWVHASWERYGRLAPFDINGHEYGYLWWHHQYEVGEVTIETLEARGYGGQYIFVAPALDLVAVVTAGNFRNRLTRQPEKLLGQFILPAVRCVPEGRCAREGR